MTAAAAARTAALNTLWSAAIVEELVRHGVDTYAVAPGSRSTPLVAAIARHPRAHGEVLTDERAAAFFALGHARGSGRPAVLVTTSGSAPAHAYPAVLEAEADGVPLLVLSADRPPELRDTGANQTLDQVGLFGGHVRWHQDLPCPTEDIALSEVIAWAACAVRRTLDPPGPVHLNLMFRKPLEPVAGIAPDPALWPDRSRPRKRWSRGVRGVSAPDAAELAGLLGSAERGLVVVGGLARAADREAARALVARLGWPVYADLASGLRLGAEAPVVPLFEALLGDPAFAVEAAPDVVLQLGGRVVSGRFERWLTDAVPREHVRFAFGPGREDPGGTVTWRLDADIAALAQVVPERPLDPRVAGWRLRSAELEDGLDERPEDPRELSEEALARLVSRAVPDGAALFVGNSMPVRHLDRWAASDGPAVPVGVNRGASGIDGLVATATGFARGCGRPVVLVLGDQSFAHDVGGLAVAATVGADLTVVVVNNAGGHIFDQLPIAAHPELLARWFTAPHGWSFAAACAAFGVPHQAVQTAAALRGALSSGIRGPRVVEVLVERG